MRNRLGGETSPYLLQHAGNPVHWYAWGDEAFAQARRSNRPVLLSVGYSACHWCHVMAHESFEDAATAEVMNRLFINVKVDREERPDIDRIYQTAHQLITQRPGGWPLTMFIDPDDQRPFFGGTYFPREPLHGMPAFVELLETVAKHFADQRGAVKAEAARIAAVFDRLEPPPADRVVPDDGPLVAARRVLGQNFDHDYGGFGTAPKFPQPASIDFLLRQWRATASAEEPDVEALYMATLTLKRMADGGLFDHVGGGFFRYSVDRYWQIPHFEKMLSDNGSLLALYAEAWLATGDTGFRDTANATADWLLTDMQSPEGGFFAARDADSNGKEGAYYLWTPDDVETAVDATLYPLVCRLFGLDQAANFEGSWHLCVRESLDDARAATGFSQDDADAALASARQALLAARTGRPAPLRDAKRLTAWNALTARGLAIAGLALERNDLIDAAGRTLEFTHTTAWDGERLHASYTDGRARFNGYLDDYVFTIDAVLHYLTARWDSSLLHFATQLADRLLATFVDDERGGFYFTSSDHETLMHRGKPIADDALPSGNGVAAIVLQRLGYLLGERRYLDAAEAALDYAWPALGEYPQGHLTLLAALRERLTPVETIVIRGPAGDIARWHHAANRLYAPGRMVFAIDAGETGLPGALAERRAKAGETVAYRCRGLHCELPVDSFEALTAGLRETADQAGSHG